MTARKPGAVRGRPAATVPRSESLHVRATEAEAALIREGALKAGAEGPHALGRWMREALIEAAGREPERSRARGRT